MKHILLFGLMSSLTTACAMESMGDEGDEVDTDSIESESHGNRRIANNKGLKNPLGKSQTFSTEGYVDLRTAFSENLGANGRNCQTCHAPDQGWTVSAEEVQDLFEDTRGLHPIFRTNDGSNNPNADVSTYNKRKAAYSMLRTRGTIRVGMPVPPTAEFELIAVDDPYGHASATELSLFRRPLPAANLTLHRNVMWDGRVSGLAPVTDPVVFDAFLAEQAQGATLGHAQRPSPLNQQVLDEIVEFETGLFNAQIKVKDMDPDCWWDDDDERPVGRTDAAGATGGAEPIAAQAVVASRFKLFDAWATSNREARRSVFRGQELFNNKLRSNGGGACRGCHSAEDIGTNANGTFFNVGTSNVQFRKADQPLYTFRNKTTLVQVQSSDPGRALVTGLFADIGKFKTPSLRALGARAPYFHGGSAKNLQEVVTFYEQSLLFDFTPDEEKDLIAFMSAL